MPANTPEETRKEVPTPEMISAMPSPVVVKSHLPFYLLHPKLLDTSKAALIQKTRNYLKRLSYSFPFSGGLRG